MAAAAADDKPAVILETPRDPDRVDSFLNIRVKDIAAVYAEWSAWGAHFLMPRRSPDRSRADHGPSGGLEPRSLAIEPIPRVARSG